MCSGSTLLVVREVVREEGGCWQSSDRRVGLACGRGSRQAGGGVAAGVDPAALGDRGGGFCDGPLKEGALDQTRVQA